MTPFYIRRLTTLILLLPTLLPAQSLVPEWPQAKVIAKTSVAIHAYSFNLKDVTLLPGSTFHQARSKDSAFLQLISPDRLLHRFRTHADLPPKDSIYGGWESEGLSGHTLGHYLSALAMQYATTGDKTFKSKLDYLIDELGLIQKVRKSGYLGAIPQEDSIFLKVSQGRIKASGFDLNGGWSPWYTVHKIMAGLCDAYYYGENKKALTLATKMADWVYATIYHLDDSTRLEMLKCEYGGMNDVLANIYAFTGIKKYLNLSYTFFDREVMTPLAQGIDPLPGKHSNTNVPKAIGSARQYELTGNARDQKIATTFWNAMIDHHTYVIGGNSNYEFCGPQDHLNDRLSDNTCETCNTYNMLKLTRHLFAWAPESKYMDYYERALYNHILASQNADDGMMCYFVPLRMGTQKKYSDTFNTFTCCVGSGMENHSKYNEQIYSHDGKNNLMVNLFIPSQVHWKKNNLTLRQTTAFPESNHITLTVETPPVENVHIAIRKPFWSKSIQCTINGTLYNPTITKEGYYQLNKNLKKNDRIEVLVEPYVYTESMPDNPDRIAFKYGPLVLAADLGMKRPNALEVPVLLSTDRTAAERVNPVKNVLRFNLSGIPKPTDLQLIPFYQIKDQYYSVYFDYINQDQWNAKSIAYQNEVLRMKDLEARTIDYIPFGIKDEESRHTLVQSERSYVDEALGRKGREARSGHYFQVNLKVDPNVENQIVFTYIGDDKNRKWDILMDGNQFKTIDWPGGLTGTFYDEAYDIPANIIEGKSVLTLKIIANHNKTAGRIFGIRTIKKK